MHDRAVRPRAGRRRNRSRCGCGLLILAEAINFELRPAMNHNEMVRAQCLGVNQRVLDRHEGGDIFAVPIAHLPAAADLDDMKPVVKDLHNEFVRVDHAIQKTADPLFFHGRKGIQVQIEERLRACGPELLANLDHRGHFTKAAHAALVQNSPPFVRPHEAEAANGSAIERVGDEGPVLRSNGECREWRCTDELPDLRVIASRIEEDQAVCADGSDEIIAEIGDRMRSFERNNLIHLVVVIGHPQAVFVGSIDPAVLGEEVDELCPHIKWNVEVLLDLRASRITEVDPDDLRLTQRTPVGHEDVVVGNLEGRCFTLDGHSLDELRLRYLS